MLVFCQVTYDEDEPNTRICVEDIRPYVDRCIIIQDGSLSPEMLKFLSEKECEVYVHPWQDSTSEQRNHYLERLQDEDWSIVSDPDEQYDIEACKHIRELIGKAEAKDFDMIQINVHDVWVKEDGTEEETVGDFYKSLIFKYNEGLRYIGQIHETLPRPWRAIRAPKEYFYCHKKTPHLVWRNAVRNHFCCGGGANLMEKNPFWLELRAMCSAIGIDTWYQFRDYLRKGNIDRRLKDWFIRYRDLDEEPWHSEIREHYLYYFAYLHPEEAPTKEEIETGHWAVHTSLKPPSWYPKGGVAEFIIGLRSTYHEILKREPSDIEKEYFLSKFKKKKFELEELSDMLKDSDKTPLTVFIAQQYYEVLGRDVDQSGFETYGTAIIDGKLKKEQLAEALRNSPEYKSRKRD